MAGKASKKFDLGELSKALAQPVPDSGTAREQIEYIDIDLLDGDPGNFYGLRDLDGLADNIATIGLQQPIRVRSGEEGHVVIVSGHRRAAAIRKLVAEGREDLRQVPCIREATEGSPSLRELRLIYANSSTRTMTGAEQSRQAEKVQELLYRLKEEGYEFPGRMRDYVAEACKISRSKLGRLDAIRHGLAPDIKRPYWDSGKGGCLSENTACELAALSMDVQRQIVDAYRGQNGNGDPGLQWLYADVVKNIGKGVKSIEGRQLKCPDGSPCGHQARQVAHLVRARIRDRWASCGCETVGCCANCATLQSCKDVCPTMRDKQKAMKAVAKEEKRQAAEEQARRDRPAIERVDSIWQRFGALRERAGLTPKAYFEAIGCPYSMLADHAEKLEAGLEKLTPETELPFGYGVHLGEIDRWRAAADALGCTVDYLMMRTDDPHTAAELAAEPRSCSGQTVLAAWMPGALTPPEPCEAVADFSLGRDVESRPMRMTCRWDGEAWRFRGSSESIDLDVIRWLRLPDVEEDADDQG